MPAWLGARFLVEAGFLITVAVVAGVERLRTLLIVILMGGAWLVVAVVEWTVARSRVAGRATPSTAESLAVEPDEEPVTSGTPVREAVGVRAERPSEPEPSPAPEVSPGGVPEPEPEKPPQEQPPTEEPAPAPEPPRIAAVAPLPEPEPEPVFAAAESEGDVISLAARSPAPREWNIWELERMAREESGDDVARDEERSFLLMYLRDFASADGTLPAGFDGVVREAFGDVLDAVYS